MSSQKFHICEHVDGVYREIPRCQVTKKAYCPAVSMYVKSGDW